MNLLLSLFFLLHLSYGTEIDPNGYVIFCPCMGRLGNQIDQLLGVMDFAKGLGRTLVLPNFIEFKEIHTSFIPFEHIFQVNAIKQFHKVVTMKEFSRDIMPLVWPIEKRTAFCWSARDSIFDPKAPRGCQAKEGNPFGPYWDKIGVNFVADEYFGGIPGGFEMEQKGARSGWLEKYPASNFPVLAFPSAPASFPSRPKVWELQRYLRWGSRVLAPAKQFINDTLSKPFLGVHLRNDRDWKSVCNHINSESNSPLFASAQCLGDRHHLGRLTKEMCSPSEATVLDTITEEVGRIGAKSVFVSSDRDHMLDEINEALRPYDVKAYRLTNNDPYISLAILGLSDHFIGNCVSTFSHIVKRERDSAKVRRPTSYFDFKQTKKRIEL